MSNLFSLEARRHKKQSQFLRSYITPASTLQDEVDSDISRLSTAAKVSEEEATKIAEDFYMRYPALIEHIRNRKYVIGEK